MRELAVNPTGNLANSERAYIQDEFSQLTKEVDRIAAVTEFNGIALGDNANQNLNVQVGIQNTANDRIAINLGDLRGISLQVDTGNVIYRTLDRLRFKPSILLWIPSIATVQIMVPCRTASNPRSTT